MSTPYRYPCTCVSCGARVDDESPEKKHNSDGDLICQTCSEDEPRYEVPFVNNAKAMLAKLGKKL